MISVCLATYNGENYIKQQLDSILNQIGIDDEVVISDDNSTDDTVTIINSFNDKRISIHKNKGKGVHQNFENAISKSKGDYIFLSDQDDVWMADKVQTCLKDFEKGYDLILSDCSIFNSETGEIVEESFFLFNNSKKGIINNILKNSYIGCCMAFSSRLKNKVLPFPKTIPMHDSWIGITGELFFKVNFNKGKLIKYRVHSQNASYTGTGKSEYSLLKKVSFRLSLCYALCRRFVFKLK
ncbi:glycosyltransferase family 2 protein [Flavobacterium notoginsengisoli]|uniref:glycosyltransferase family 2 protein n=1 Tax=Flavobacterium notoginsengisoli TaxID=1478199 RepID=UPI003626691D